MNSSSQNRVGLRPLIFVALGLAGLAALVGCNGKNEPAPDPTALAEASGAPDALPLPIATVEPVTRGELLAAANTAADETAAGKPLPSANTDLVNRSFELRLPFGCPGSNAAKWGEWNFDPATRVLRISVRPERWGEDQTMKALAAGMIYDGAEGFWVTRPWTRSETCPASQSPPTSPASAPANPGPASSSEIPVPRTLAIVQYHSPDAPRTLRRGSRPYGYTGKVAQGLTPGSQGFRLKLTGRIRGFGDGQPVHCIASTPSGPPICAIAVEFTQVTLEDAGSGESLAVWDN